MLDFLPTGHSFPTNVHLVERWRDIVLLDWPTAATTPTTFTRTAVVLDKRADPRLFEIITALHYQNLAVRANLLALAKVSGKVRWWYGDPNTYDKARQAVMQATNAAFWPSDRINCEIGIVCPMKDGKLVSDQLPEDDLLRKALPSQYRLGLVVRS